MPRLALLLLVLAPAALAARLEIPLRVPLDSLSEALRAESYREGPCRYLHLEQPKLEVQQGRLRFTGPGKAALGIELAGKCQSAAAWRGSVQLELLPRLDQAGRLRLRIVDSRLVDASGAKAPGMLWQLSKRQVHARLERFSYDIGASRETLLRLLRSAAPPADMVAMERVVRELQVLEPRVEASHVVVPLALEVPDAWLAVPPAAASAAPLTEAEMEALDAALEPWDAFLVYILRQVALDGRGSALRQRLFTLLLDSRYQLVSIIAGDVQTAGDPLRALFVEAWNELRTILTDAQRDGTLPPSLLRYALFIDAGDALMALENAAPGLSLSADGLRQLARSLRPGDTADPLAYKWDVDTELRGLFEVIEPAEAESAPRPLPTKSWLDLFIGRAYADQALDRWVPTKDELADYETRITALLNKISANELQRAGFAAPYDQIYRHLVPTTALIESCWRQYVVRGGKVTYLRSPSQSVGIMQINQKVWRGFYDVQRLRWDTAYNMRAGVQILARYVKDYAIPYAEKSGDPNDVPRAAYAVYNAGPRAVGRFAKPKPHPREARVDEKLRTLYEGIAAGSQVDLASCGVKPLPTAAR